MKTLIEHARSFTGFCENNTLYRINMAGAVLILFGFMIFAGFFQVVITGVLAVTFATLGTLLLFGYCLRLNALSALIALPLLLLMLWIALLISAQGPTPGALITLLVVLFLGALPVLWQFLFPANPSLTGFDYLCQAFTAPMILATELSFKLGWQPELKQCWENKSSHIDWGTDDKTRS